MKRSAQQATNCSYPRHDTENPEKKILYLDFMENHELRSVFSLGLFPFFHVVLAYFSSTLYRVDEKYASAPEHSKTITYSETPFNNSNYDSYQK